MKTSEARHTAVITTARSVVCYLVEPDGYGHFVAQNTLYVLCRGVLYGSGVSYTAINVQTLKS